MGESEIPQYAIAGSREEFDAWLAKHPGADAIYLTKELAEQYLADGAKKGVLLRIGRWHSSPARETAERLEDAPEGGEEG